MVIKCKLDFFEVLPGALSVQKQSSRGVLLKEMFLEISQNLQENAFYLVGGSYVILKTYGMKERVSSKGL